MKIDGKGISDAIIKHLKSQVKTLRPPKLAVISVKADEEGQSFIGAKGKAVKKIGGKFEWVHFKRTPRFQVFAERVKKTAGDEEIDGIVLQKPLPPELSSVSLFNYIPDEKEIEAHKKKTPFHHPIGLATLTVLKYLYHPSDKKNVDNLIVRLPQDTAFFKNTMKKKRVVLIGRGETGGKPISKILTEAKINFLNTHSRTPHPERFYKDADIIISAVGQYVLKPENLKPGVVLISVGIRKEDGKWQGDYREDEVKNIASHYTPTPGGIGPLDISYLMYNLVQAVKIRENMGKS